MAQSASGMCSESVKILCGADLGPAKGLLGRGSVMGGKARHPFAHSQGGGGATVCGTQTVDVRVVEVGGQVADRHRGAQPGLDLPLERLRHHPAAQRPAGRRERCRRS